MGKTLAAVVDDAHRPSPIDRARLLEEIYRSLETEEARLRSDAWAAKGESRVGAHDRGDLESLDQ